MPKFIGRKLAGATQIHDNASEHGTARVRLTYAQAALLPAAQVVCSLDTTDRGSKGSYAKRWYRWFASAAAILTCEHSTPSMIAKAGAARTAGSAVEAVAIDAELSGRAGLAAEIRESLPAEVCA